MRGQRTAGRAPVCGEIYDHWELGPQHTLFKVLVVHLKQVCMLYCHGFLLHSSPVRHFWINWLAPTLSARYVRVSSVLGDTALACSCLCPLRDDRRGVP